MQKRLTKSTGLRFALLAGIVALVQMRILVLMFGPQYKLSVDAAAGVLRGEPHWRVYQNRLLGPWLVQVASHVFDTFLDAHVFCSVVLLGVSGFVVLWQLSRIHADTGRTLAGYFAFALLVVCCFQRPWFYIWDCVDLLIFVLFNAFVVRQRSWRWFAALFAVAILNREGAYFIALWMIVDPLVRRVLDRGRGAAAAPLDRMMLAAGVVLLGAGAALVELLRTQLLVREVGPDLVGEVEGAGSRFHFMLPGNLERLADSLTSFPYTMSFLVPVGLAAFVGYCFAVARRDPPRRLGAALVHVAMAGAMIVFGVLFETRIYVVLIPFVVLNAPWGGPVESS